MDDWLQALSQDTGEVARRARESLVMATCRLLLRREATADDPLAVPGRDVDPGLRVAVES